jgi:hypothetical protein
LSCSRPETQFPLFGGQYLHGKSFISIDESDPLRKAYPISLTCHIGRGDLNGFVEQLLLLFLELTEIPVQTEEGRHHGGMGQEFIRYR